MSNDSPLPELMIVLSVAGLSPGPALADQVAPALTHRPTEYELTWKNSSKSTVIVRNALPATAHDECQIDWSRVPTVPPGGTAKIPVRCTFGAFGSTAPEARSKRIDLVVLDAQTRETRQESLNLRTTVYPASLYTDEPDTCTGRPKKCSAEPFQPRIRLCFVDRKNDDAPNQNIGDVECRGARKISLTDSAQMGEAITQIRSQECGIVEEVRIYGHSNEQGIWAGSFMGGPKAIAKTFKAGQDRCAMSKDLKIVYKGCYSGYGCLGQINMYVLADSIGKEQATVLSPTSYVINSRLTFFKGGSINFKERKLTTTRSSGAKGSIQTESWELVGKLADGSPTLSQQCTELCAELKTRVAESIAYWKARPACEKDVANQQRIFLEVTQTDLRSCASEKLQASTAPWIGGSTSAAPTSSQVTHRLEELARTQIQTLATLEKSDEAMESARKRCSSGTSITDLSVKDLLPDMKGLLKEAPASAPPPAKSKQAQ